MPMTCIPLLPHGGMYHERAQLAIHAYSAMLRATDHTNYHDGWVA